MYPDMRGEFVGVSGRPYLVIEGRRTPYGHSSLLFFHQPLLEGEHPVVWVAAEAPRDRDAGVEAAVERPADVVQRLHLEHQVVNPLRQREGSEGEGVVASVRAQEGDLERDLSPDRRTS